MDVCVFEGYDSDVAREKTVDYVTKMHAASFREMRGIKPQQQQKELSPEERYAHVHAHVHTRNTRNGSKNTRNKV